MEARFGAIRAPPSVEGLSDNGSIYTARDTSVFASQLNPVPCFTPVASPESNGRSEAFVKTLKRDHLRVSPVPDAGTALGQIAGGFDDDTENHPPSGLRTRSPRAFRRAHQPAKASGRNGGDASEVDLFRRPVLGKAVCDRGRKLRVPLDQAGPLAAQHVRAVRHVPPAGAAVERVALQLAQDGRGRPTKRQGDRAKRRAISLQTRKPIPFPRGEMDIS